MIWSRWVVPEAPRRATVTAALVFTNDSRFPATTV